VQEIVNDRGRANLSSPLDQPWEAGIGPFDWYLVARIAPNGGMFDGRTGRFKADYTFGEYQNDPYQTTDFYRPFPLDEIEEILFITGDSEYWIRFHYSWYRPEGGTFPIYGVNAVYQGGNDFPFGSNDGITESAVEPFGFATQPTGVVLGWSDYVFWAEEDYSGSYETYNNLEQFKNDHDGINVYVRNWTLDRPYQGDISVSYGSLEVVEGSSAVFYFSMIDGDEDTEIDYQIDGSLNDFVDNKLTGFAVFPEGTSTINIEIPIKDDQLLEGDESFTISFNYFGRHVGSFQVQILDSSAISLSANAQSYDEGSEAIFTILTSNVALGTLLSYSISGVSSDDITAALSGEVSVGSNGLTTISIPIVADLTTEGSETLTMTVNGVSASTLINDTSLPQAPKLLPTYALVPQSVSANEGETVAFTLSTTNVEEGTSVSYTLSGISPSDVKAGLSGKVEIDANGQALITISILEDHKTEGDETLTVIVEDQSASVLIRDTSKNPAGVTPGKRANSSANEKFEAASGETKLEFAGNSGNFKVRSNDGGRTWELSSPDTGTDTVTGFKRIALDDKTIALDFQAGDAGYSSVMLIGAAFGKDLVPTYFSAGLTFFDAGLDTAYLCDLIQSAGLIESQIGQTSTGAWIKHVYKNVVGVFPDELTELVFTDLIDSGVYTRATLLKAAAELSLLESQVDITGLQSTGLTYTPFG
jgi:hypothetical protein